MFVFTFFLFFFVVSVGFSFSSPLSAIQRRGDIASLGEPSSVLNGDEIRGMQKQRAAPERSNCFASRHNHFTEVNTSRLFLSLYSTAVFWCLLQCVHLETQWSCKRHCDDARAVVFVEWQDAFGFLQKKVRIWIRNQKENPKRNNVFFGPIYNNKNIKPITPWTKQIFNKTNEYNKQKGLNCTVSKSLNMQWSAKSDDRWLHVHHYPITITIKMPLSKAYQDTRDRLSQPHWCSWIKLCACRRCIGTQLPDYARPRVKK